MLSSFKKLVYWPTTPVSHSLQVFLAGQKVAIDLMTERRSGKELGYHLYARGFKTKSA